MVVGVDLSELVAGGIVSVARNLAQGIGDTGQLAGGVVAEGRGEASLPRPQTSWKTEPCLATAAPSRASLRSPDAGPDTLP